MANASTASPRPTVWRRVGCHGDAFGAMDFSTLPMIARGRARASLVSRGAVSGCRSTPWPKKSKFDGDGVVGSAGAGAALGQGKDTTLQHCGRSSTIALGQDLEAMVVSRPQLPDIPWDPLSCEWGVMSMPVTLVVDLHGCAGLMVQSTRSQSSRWTIAPRFRTGPSIPCWLKRRHV